MDTTDPDITFDDKGVCNHCNHHDYLVKTYLFTGDTGRTLLDSTVNKIKKEGRGKEYDCIIGVSGGVDSSFVAYSVKKLGLRSLAVHLDNGWDSELSVKNIELLLNKLEIDLYTYVLNWEEFRDIQLSFLKASTPDTEAPTDHAIFALLHEKAREMNIRYIINGCNLRTETHLPPAWSHDNSDWKYIKSVHKQFGTMPLKTFPHYTLLQKQLYRRRLKWFSILNYLDYSKKDAMKILENELGWKYYGGKHYESIFTRFYQGYLLPKKFGYDKRRAHLSSLICAGETTRNDSLEVLKQDTYPPGLLEQDKEFVIKKFELTADEFENLMSLPNKTYRDYPSYGRSFDKIESSPLYDRFLRRAYRKFVIQRNINEYEKIKIH